MKFHQIKIRVLFLGVAVSAVLWASTAQASCPKSGSPSREVCKYSRSLLMPSAVGKVFMPSSDDVVGPWYGGGLQVVLFTWSDNSEHFGPGQGAFFFDIGILSSGEDDVGKMVMFRGGAHLSVERNASRSWLIPYYGAAVGGLHESSLQRRGFAEGLLGLYAWYSANFIADLEFGYLFPFQDADLLAGFTAQATLSFSLW